jgi:prevent-host-death family protein
MDRIGVRELRRDASRWLARVKAGESFVITERGDPIARLGPWVERGGYLALVADGALVQGSGRPLEDLLAAIDDEHPEDPREASLGEALAALRREER